MTRRRKCWGGSRKRKRSGRRRVCCAAGSSATECLERSTPTGRTSMCGPPNAEERMRGEPAVTQFGPMCAKLGIRIIAASSPQAKGRVERAHGTHQDRLVKKLRLAGIATYDHANAYLDEHYLAEHNRRYATP